MVAGQARAGNPAVAGQAQAGNRAADGQVVNFGIPNRITVYMRPVNTFDILSFDATQVVRVGRAAAVPRAGGKSRSFESKCDINFVVHIFVKATHTMSIDATQRNFLLHPRKNAL